MSIRFVATPCDMARFAFKFTPEGRGTMDEINAIRDDSREWLAEHFGKDNMRYYADPYSNVYLRDKNDAFEFKMRWC